jgi:hypothetical protein
MFNIVPSNQNQSSFGIDGRCLNHRQSARAVAGHLERTGNELQLSGHPGQGQDKRKDKNQSNKKTGVCFHVSHQV